MHYPQSDFVHTTLGLDSVLGQRRRAVFSQTIPYQLQVLKETGRYDAFKLEWHKTYSEPPEVWPIPNHLFWDSDVAKWIEGACYFLHFEESELVNSAIHELVGMIRSAQQPDGYLNIHFTVVEPNKRFTNLRDFHELYNAGHLIEAALAHYALFKNDLLLSPIIKYVDLLCQTFGLADHQLKGYPGHPEIELALLRLYDVTREQKHFDLAEFFITQRGTRDSEHFFVAEAARRGDNPHCRPAYYPKEECLWYYLAHEPIIEQKSIEGHAVRATYLLTAVADLVRIQPDYHSEYQVAVRRLWENMVQKKMYLTGGIGAMEQWEGFGIDYFLPQATDEGGCYAETCAAIGVIMLAERLLRIELDGQFGDIMELCLYNAMLTGISCDGKSFTYDNQLASSEGHPSKRHDWFTVSCCPPNVSRLLGHIGGYIWSYESDVKEQTATINVHLFTKAELKFSVGENVVSLQQDTEWPWEGRVKFNLLSDQVKTRLRIRIPSWTTDWKITPMPSKISLEKGYLNLDPEWLSENHSFMFTSTLVPRLLTPHPYTNQDIVAVARGPIVYCVEEADNKWVTDHFKSLLFDPTCKFTEQWVTDEKTDEKYVAITAYNAVSFLNSTSLASGPGMQQSDDSTDGKSVATLLKFVPYYFRANRPRSEQMRVGLKRLRKEMEIRN